MPVVRHPPCVLEWPVNNWCTSIHHFRRIMMFLFVHFIFFSEYILNIVLSIYRIILSHKVTAVYINNTVLRHLGCYQRFCFQTYFLCLYVTQTNQMKLEMLCVCLFFNIFLSFGYFLQICTLKKYFLVHIAKKLQKSGTFISLK